MAGGGGWGGAKTQKRWPVWGLVRTCPPGDAAHGSGDNKAGFLSRVSGRTVRHRLRLYPAGAPQMLRKSRQGESGASAPFPKRPSHAHRATGFQKEPTTPLSNPSGQRVLSKRRKQAGDKEKCFSPHKFFRGNGFPSGHLSTRLASRSHTATQARSRALAEPTLHHRSRKGPI